MVLEQILSSKGSTSFILIHDTIRLSSLSLLTDLSKRALDDNKTVIAVLTETSPQAWRERFGNNENVFIVDCYSDPFGWDQVPDEADQNTVKITNIHEIEKSVLSAVINKALNSPSFQLIVDSIIPFAQISQHRTYQFVKSLESLTTESSRLAIGFHSDLKLSSKTGLTLHDSLTRLASAVIKLEPLKERTHFETQSALTGFIPQATFSYLTVTSNCATKGGIAHIEWRKKSGKVQYHVDGFVLNSQGYVDVVPVSQLTGVVEQPEPVEAMEVDTKSDPTANLSFNLSLTDEQRKAKDNLVLPFMKAQQLEVSTDEEKQNSSLIYYDPDAADDFDDEDPDEDLDI